MKRSIELLAPAGTFKNLQYAYAYGADAVYAGLPRYSLRVRNNDFRNAERVKMGIDYAHEHGKKFFLALNTMPHGGKLKTFVDDIAPIIQLNPDALIMSDPGLIMLVRERFPDIDIHLSVQSNAVNSATVQFWQKQGLTRVILSRELSLNEIEEIRNECPDMEIEVFVHGALCIAYSGRCLLSGYFNHRDANQGTCTNACRWNYGLTEAKQTPEGELIPIHADMNNIYTSGSAHPHEGINAVKFIQDGMNEPAYTDLTSGKAYTPHPKAEEVYLIQENNQRKGEWMEISEDENGTYIMNSRDLRAIQHVARLIEIGVDSLKIEGRTKSPYYVARTAQLYRQAIDDALAGREFNPELYGKLDGLANRGYTAGFLERHPAHAYQNYITGNSIHSRQQYVAEVTEYNPETGLSRLVAKNRFATGDRVEIINQHGNRDIVIGEMKDEEGNVVDVAKGSPYEVYTDIGPADEMTMVARYLTQE